MTGWADALDRYEAALDHHAALLRTGEPAPGPVPWPPPELPRGALPGELGPRAAALVARSDELARELAAARDSLPPLPAGHRPPARPTAPPPGAGRVDRAL